MKFTAKQLHKIEWDSTSGLDFMEEDLEKYGEDSAYYNMMHEFANTDYSYETLSKLIMKYGFTSAHGWARRHCDHIKKHIHNKFNNKISGYINESN